MAYPGASSGGAIMNVQGASADIVRSGHLELDTIYASNDSTVGRQAIQVNVLNAPNNSTVLMSLKIIIMKYISKLDDL